MAKKLELKLQERDEARRIHGGDERGRGDFVVGGVEGRNVIFIFIEGQHAGVQQEACAFGTIGRSSRGRARWCWG